MAEQYQDGEVLKGSDGKTYVVVGGVPREQVAPPVVDRGIYRLPVSPEKQAKEQREARGAELAEEGAVRAEETAVREESKDIRDRIKELRSAYRGEAAVTDYEKSLPNYTAALKTKPGEDLTLLYLWAKTVDPNSTVGASDMENINTSDARLPAAVQSALRELRASEGKFTDEARERLRSGLHQIITQKREAYDFTRERYAADAQAPEYNIDPERVIFKPFGSRYFNDIQAYWEEQYKKNPASVPPEYRPETPAGGAGGPVVSVSMEESVAAFGQPAYDAQGNLVGRAYQQQGGTIYDAEGNELGLTGAVTEEELQQPAPSFFGGLARSVGEAITGEERATATTEALPDWTDMPELQQLLSVPAFKAAIGTAFGGGPQEIAQIVQSQFPDTQVFQDEKGNYILQSPSSGQRYAIKPGFQFSDVPRALSILLAGGGIQGGVRGAMAVGGREAAMQTGVEALQAGTGGTFNVEDILAAGGGGAALQKAGEILPAAAGRVIGTMRRGAPPAPAMPTGAPELPGGITLPSGRVTTAPAAAIPAGAPPSAAAQAGYAIPEAPSQLNKPRVPTKQEMEKFSAVENVDLQLVRRGQDVFSIQENMAGKYSEPLIEGFGDIPVGVRLENGEIIAYDGNHRVALALGQGREKMPMYVIDAKKFDPENMGRKPAAQTGGMTDEELLAELGGPRMFEAGETVTSRAGGAMGTSPESVRLMQAEGLPVPVELTRGAATRDPEQLAFEKEQLFGSLGGPLRKRAEENNLQALQNFDRFIDMTGAEAPDIAATGNSVIKALSQGYQASKNRVRAAYTRADKANETAEMVSYAPIVDFINQQTPTTRTTLAPILQSTLEKIRLEDPAGSGMISIRSMEDIRKSINKQAQPGTPNDTYGSSIKGLIDDATEGAGGELYQEARRLRIEQADKFEKRAIVARLVSNIKNMDDRRVPADKVFQSAILNESPENIRFLRSTLRELGDDGKQAWGELQAATLRHLQERATGNVNLTAENIPVISAAQLNKAVSELDKNGRLDLIFNPKMAQQIRDLRDVVQYVNTVPPGTSINNSGTARTLAAMMVEMGATFTGTGIPLPLITGVKLIRDQVKDAKIKKQINRSLLPRGERD